MDLAARVQGIILRPKEEWMKIKDESMTVSQIFTNYAMILAAIPALSYLIGLGIIGRKLPFIGLHRYGVGTGFLYALFHYLGTLVSVFIAGLVINALAPTFSSKQNQENAMKLVVFSMTPGWVAGIFHILPFLGWLAVLGSLYGIYVLYLGFSAPLMETPKEKVPGYVILSIIVTVVLMVIVSMVLGTIFLVGAAGGVY